MVCFLFYSGHPLLRAEAAKLHGMEQEDILTIVPQEGIYIAMHCLAKYLITSVHNYCPV